MNEDGSDRLKEPLRTLFLEILVRRRYCPDYSAKIARDGFTKSHHSRIGRSLTEFEETLHDELGALEAPGRPPKPLESLQKYEDKLWRR